jgi:hypothetical protein
MKTITVEGKKGSVKVEGQIMFENGPRTDLQVIGLWTKRGLAMISGQTGTDKIYVSKILGGGFDLDWAI